MLIISVEITKIIDEGEQQKNKQNKTKQTKKERKEQGRTEAIVKE